MGILPTIENKLAEVFKDLPQLPDSSKEGLAKVWSWLALISGILQLLGAFILYKLTNYADHVIYLANSKFVYSSNYPSQTFGPSSVDKSIIYLGVLMLIVDGVILLLAFPKLQKRQKSGWDLLFLGALINVVYGVVQIFTFQRGIFSFMGSLIGSTIAVYLLFQIREKYHTAHTPVSNSRHPRQ